MPANHPNLRPAAAGLLLALAVMLLIPAVSAEELLIDEGAFTTEFTIEGVAVSNINNIIHVYRIQDYTELKTLYLSDSGLMADEKTILQNNPTYTMPVTLKIGTTTVGHGIAGYNGLFSSSGAVIGYQQWIDITDFNVYSYTGQKQITVVPDSGTLFNGIKGLCNRDTGVVSESQPIGFSGYGTVYMRGGYVIARSNYHWENIIDVTANDVKLIRNIDGVPYVSTLSIVTSNTVTDTSNSDISIPYAGTGTWSVTSPHGKTFSGNLGGIGGTDDGIVTVYVRNSQTGALLADAHILIEGTPTTSDWTEYVNTTLPSGTGSYSLPGIPYQFRILAELPGYTSTGYQYFRAGDTVIVDLEPYIDAPTNESNTFLEFYIRDLNANPLGGATVEVGEQWLYSNNNGYARFEVAKNATYPYTVQKSGYMTISGTATVADGPRYTVNVALGAGTVPTLTPTPTEPGATPTPDRRTNEEKGQAIIDMIADFAEPIALLAIVATVFGLMQMMMPRRR